MDCTVLHSCAYTHSYTYTHRCVYYTSFHRVLACAALGVLSFHSAVAAGTLNLRMIDVEIEKSPRQAHVSAQHFEANNLHKTLKPSLVKPTGKEELK